MKLNSSQQLVPGHCGKQPVQHFNQVNLYVLILPDAHTALSLAKIETHYFINNSFLEKNQILAQMDKLKDVSGIIVQGRYDIVCPMTSAWELHQKWPQSRLEIVVSAGHSAKEASITDALIRATNEVAKEIKKLS